MLRKLRGGVAARNRGSSNSEDEKELHPYSPKQDDLDGDLFGDAGVSSSGHKVKDSDRELFEGQIMILQEQLTSSYVETQDLKDELTDLQKDRDEIKSLLSQELAKRQALESDLEKRTAAAEALEGEEQQHKTQQEAAVLQDEFAQLAEKLTAEAIEKNEYKSKWLALTEASATASKGRKHSLRDAVSRYYTLLLEMILAKVYEIADLMEQPPEGSSADAEASLHLITLRDNFKRFMTNLRIIINYFKWIDSILSWKRPFETLMIFLLLVGSIWTGWVFQLVLAVVLAKLSYTYLTSSGLSDRFAINLTSPTEQEPEQSNLSTLNIVKEVAIKIQVYSAIAADNIEKFFNFVQWRYPDGTMWLYTRLWIILLFSLFTPPPYFYVCIGLAITFKFFFINTIYRKYPKIQDKYDSVARIWAALPTNAELEERQAWDRSRMQQHLSDPARSSRGNAARKQLEQNGWEVTTPTGITGDEIAFCERFSLDRDNKPLPDWKNGIRCTLFDRDKPLRNFKNGRFFLTDSRLCFEQSIKSKDMESRFTINLADIEHMAKAKPFGVMPGSGMSIEVAVKGRHKPYVFGGVINRDNVLQMLEDHGLMKGHQWAVNITARTSIRSD